MNITDLRKPSTVGEPFGCIALTAVFSTEDRRLFMKIAPWSVRHDNNAIHLTTGCLHYFEHDARVMPLVSALTVEDVRR